MWSGKYIFLTILRGGRFRLYPLKITIRKTRGKYMYLKRLELQGFKSFANKTVLEFMPGITGVVGPNGSGKSNISDAIRWVLGEQSMKSLRSNKSLDVIFAGTENRKSLGFAEVSLIFDNSDRALDIEYSEVTVSRRIFRSGETGYFINKTPCRLKDVLELFMDTGIGKDGYSIIGQGKVDEILSNKSEDRRHIFEEAAGIVKYRTRKEETEKKLEQTKLNLLRINDILSEIDNNIDSLKLQSDKAKKFLDLREELKSIEVGLFLYNIDTYKEKIKEFENDLLVLQNNEKEENNKLNSLNSLKEEIRTQIDEITHNIEKTQNLGFESKNLIEKLNSEINVSNERINNNNANTQRYSEEIEEAKQKIEDIKSDKEQKTSKIENLKANKEKFENELLEKENELREITSKLSEKELEIEGKKQIVEQNTDKKYELQTEISNIKVNLENLKRQENWTKSEISANISEIDATRMNKSEMESNFYQIEKQKNEIFSKLEAINKEKEASTTKLKDYEEDLSRINIQIQMKSSKCKFLMETEKEKEGYGQSVKELINACENDKTLSKGVCGVLANLITTEKEYETAIEIALGSNMQNIITETEEDAKRLVEYLKQNNLGRASFLPISSVKGKKLDKFSKENGVIGIASDLIKYDQKYEQIVLNLLGKTVIVDNMENAIKLSRQNEYSFKVITLEGEVINPSGMITGGSISKKTVNILGRGRQIEELQREIAVLENQKNNLQKEKEEYESSTIHILQSSKELEEKMQEINIIYATENQKRTSLEEGIAKLEEKLEKLKQELQNIDNQRKEYENSSLEKQEQIQNLQKEIDELQKIITEFANSNSEAQKHIDDLTFDITNLKISVSSFNESQSSIEEIFAMLEQDIQNTNKVIESKQTQIEKMKIENEELVKSIDDKQLEIKNINEQVLNSAENIENLKAERISKNEKLSNVENDVISEFNVLEELKAQITKVDVKKIKQQQDLEEIINKMWEEYEITPNSNVVYQKPDNVALTQRRVNNLRLDMRNLGSVNIDAIEEYSQTKQRYDFMCEQRLDLENTISKLRKMISEMTDTMKEQFLKQFKLINKNFGEVFAELFGGGKAELTLTDESNVLECGIEINVQPPGKKLQSMLLLSGGERAFSAIALLFAILKINPAPFCILDEIEAALDDVNVYRYAEYLKKFAKQTQFLVITHRKGTMEAADTVYGITMEEKGISKLLSLKFGMK